MEDSPIIIFRTVTKPNGNMKQEKLYCYAALLTDPATKGIAHMQLDGYANKYDAMKDIWSSYPGWKVKTILKLYESDFREG